MGKLVLSRMPSRLIAVVHSRLPRLLLWLPDPLGKASESPGGMLADFTDPEFPSAQLAESVTIGNTTAGLADLDLDSFQVTTVDFPNTKLLTLTASDPETWRASTWDKDHD